MKITDVEAIHLRIEDPNIQLFDGSYDTCVVVVETDEGLTGIGEVESLAPAIQGVINAPAAHNHAVGLRELLLGQDPTDPPRLWQEMYDATDYIGRRGLVMHAIGGVDIALWDLAGKAAGKPVYDLIGGKKRDRIPVYGTIYPLARDPAEVARQIRAVREMNLRAFKYCADPWWMDDLDDTAVLLRAARAEAGNDAVIIVDAALSYDTVEEGLRLLPILKDIGVFFLEAPLPLDNLEGHAAIAGRGVPIGVGDLGLTHVDEFIEFMDRGRADICQPDITMVGGITGIRRIADAARARRKRLIPHAYKTNIEIAANTHFMAAYSDAEMMEWPTSKSPLRWNTTREHLPVEPDGTVRVPDRPGLGVTLDWKFVTETRWTPK